MTPADELTAAAAKLQSAAQHADGQKWIADHYPEGTIVHPADSTVSLFRLAADGMRAAGTPHVMAPVGEYIALMCPDVGDKLSRWLDSAARDAREIGPDPHAVAVARAINQSQP